MDTDCLSAALKMAEQVRMYNNQNIFCYIFGSLSQDFKFLSELLTYAEKEQNQVDLGGSILSTPNTVNMQTWIYNL